VKLLCDATMQDAASDIITFTSCQTQTPRL